MATLPDRVPGRALVALALGVAVLAAAREPSRRPAPAPPIDRRGAGPSPSVEASGARAAVSEGAVVAGVTAHDAWLGDSRP